jgi:hypothetical protein
MRRALRPALRRTSSRRRREVASKTGLGLPAVGGEGGGRRGADEMREEGAQREEACVGCGRGRRGTGLRPERMRVN